MVRQGHSQRSVARRFRVSLHTIQRWVQRAGVLPLQEVEWGSRSKTAHQIANKTPADLEQEVCLVRKQLAKTGALGFVGAQAIQDTLRERAGLRALPSVRTIGRILKRRGLLDGQRRVRAPPPPGWYLPDVAQQLAELDSFDVVEDLRMENLGLFQLFTTRALWGPLAEAWPARVASTSFILQALQAHWQCHGLPAFAQFDNDVRFQGGHNHPDVIGRVMRFCLALGVTPVCRRWKRVSKPSSKTSTVCGNKRSGHAFIMKTYRHSVPLRSVSPRLTEDTWRNGAITSFRAGLFQKIGTSIGNPRPWAHLFICAEPMKVVASKYWGIVGRLIPSGSIDCCAVTSI